ncbi:LysR family transcriptional regulator [Gluconobacter oxydans]|uniref:LysR family transcriptional regulator n=1 Tax=Gluconobacter oxydans TaxID=442 RepID=UPI0039E9C46C
MKDQMHLDPFHLQSFLAVAETLHFTSAAQSQGVSQSTISQHVSRLEEQLGTRLLARSTKSVRLTEDGTALIGLARQLLQCEDSILSRFRQETPRGTIRLGVTEDLLLTRFPEILGTFRASHPSLQITMTVGLSAYLARLLDQGELDVWCGMRRTTETRGQKLWTEDMRWYAPAGTEFPAEQSIPLVTFPDGSVTRRLAIETLNKAGRAWHLAFTSGSLGALLAAVRAGYGVTPQPAFLRNVEHLPHCAPGLLPEMPQVEFIASTRHQTAQGPEELLIRTLCAHIPRLQPDLLPL